ncbi:MAG: phosphoribosylanthranilate isomerase [Alkalilacustris sp.]
MTRPQVKMCGLRSPADVAAAARAGAAYVGLVFFPPSPRSVTPTEGRAAALAAPPGLARVGLVVDPDDALLEAILAVVPLDMLQLHGHESPARVAAIRARFGLPVMKAVGLAGPADLREIDRHASVADQILVDARPAPGATLPGGNGIAFDWRLLQGRRWPLPWMLAGGLTEDNVAEAIRLTGATQIDVSSGVESSPGVKDPDRMTAFITAAG